MEDKMGKKRKGANKRNRVIPATNIPLMPDPMVPDLEEYDDWDYLNYPIKHYTYKKPTPKVDPVQQLFLEKQMVSHYIETIPENCNKKIVYVMQGDGMSFRVDAHRLVAGEDDLHGTLQEKRRQRGLRLNGQVLLPAERSAVGDQLNLDLTAINAEHGCDLLLVVVDSLTL